MNEEEYILSDLLLERMTLGQPINTHPFIEGLIRLDDRERFGDELYIKLHSLVTYGGITTIRTFLLNEGYIKCENPSIPRDVLTDKGKEAQLAGGHFKYLDKKEQERQFAELKEKEQNKINWPQKHWLVLLILTAIISPLIVGLIQQRWLTTPSEAQPIPKERIDTVYFKDSTKQDSIKAR